MRVLVAPNAFKGTLTAAQAASAMAAGVRQAWPQALVTELPLSDGGDGFLKTVVSVRGGRISKRVVPGPLQERTRAPIGWVSGAQGSTAVVELAAASGLALIPNPTPATAGAASTRGLGTLIRLALQSRPHTVLVGIGGSSSTDGGTGMARALGFRFLREDGSEVPEGGLGLLDLDRIDATGAEPRLAEVQVVAACDVTNPLLGPFGAAAVYGPQKGADPGLVQQLELGLARLALVAARDLGTAGMELRRGSGAAGGTGFGLVAFLGARLAPGVEVVADAAGLDPLLEGSDLVFTGEGRFDRQSLEGKVPGEVARRARRLGVPCLVIAGSVEAEALRQLHELGGRLVELDADLRSIQAADSRQLGLIRRRARTRVLRAAIEACALAAGSLRPETGQ
jgi:glycerate kinase